MQQAGQRRIIFRTGFDVHSSFLDQTFISKIFQNFRMRAVCVKLDRITEIVDFLYKVFKVRRKRWFAAGDTDTFKDSLTLF